MHPFGLGIFRSRINDGPGQNVSAFMLNLL
jgi:hypothetical protein